MRALNDQTRSLLSALAFEIRPPQRPNFAVGAQPKQHQIVNLVRNHDLTGINQLMRIEASVDDLYAPSPDCSTYSLVCYRIFAGEDGNEPVCTPTLDGIIDGSE
ncbi:hypothetical protein [Asaia bogorensis]|uniref:hypothetical protein n=1 Tax=Asaia bogorensis TaxID=91915 RepID=UPI001F08F930|nr:hypothetical protein [Asaia bogorensis]